jgi:hypothetical protein
MTTTSEKKERKKEKKRKKERKKKKKKKKERKKKQKNQPVSSGTLSVQSLGTHASTILFSLTETASKPV